MLAESWTDDINPTGYLLSEKLDGVRAFWDGKQFFSRQGNRFHAPSWFTVGLPLEPLDGELWIARKSFQRTLSVVKRQDESVLWNELRFLVFDAPADESVFEKRLELIDTIMEINRPPFAQAHRHIVCNGRDHLQDELARVESLGGEGLMLRQPGSIYAAGRSSTLLKVKRFHDAEARVVGYEPGKGRHKGRMGALLVEMANGVQFAIGTGFTDGQRSQPAPIGSTVTFKYQELTDRGAPRFASYVGIRADLPIHTNLFSSTQGDNIMPSIVTTRRRFEFIGGGSDKFWEVSVNALVVGLIPHGIDLYVEFVSKDRRFVVHGLHYALISTAEPTWYAPASSDQASNVEFDLEATAPAELHCLRHRPKVRPIVRISLQSKCKLRFAARRPEWTSIPKVVMILPVQLL